MLEARKMLLRVFGLLGVMPCERGGNQNGIQIPFWRDLEVMPCARGGKRAAPHVLKGRCLRAWGNFRPNLGWAAVWLHKTFKLSDSA